MPCLFETVDDLLSYCAVVAVAGTAAVAVASTAGLASVPAPEKHTFRTFYLSAISTTNCKKVVHILVFFF